MTDQSKLFPAIEAAARAAAGKGDTATLTLMQSVVTHTAHHDDMLAILQSIIAHADEGEDADAILAAHDKAIRRVIAKATGGKNNG